MVVKNEAFLRGVFQKVEGSLEVIAKSGADPKDQGEIQTIATKLALDLSPGEVEMVVDMITGTSASPYATPPKGVVDRYDFMRSRWELFKLGQALKKK